MLVSNSLFRGVFLTGEHSLPVPIRGKGRAWYLLLEGEFQYQGQQEDWEGDRKKV